MIPGRARRWAWDRVMSRWPEGALITPRGLDWLALLLLETGRYYLRTRWRAWTTLPGDRVVCRTRRLEGEVLKLHRAGEATIVAVSEEALMRDPLARVRPCSPVEGFPLFVRDDSAPGGGYVTPFVTRGSLRGDWTR